MYRGRAELGDAERVARLIARYGDTSAARADRITKGPVALKRTAAGEKGRNLPPLVLR
jgi:hypothetical protein